MRGNIISRHGHLSIARTFGITLLLAVSLVGVGSTGVGATGTAAAASSIPTIVTVTPEDGAMSVPTSVNASNNVVTATAVSATFTTPMDPATISSTPAGSVLTFTVASVNGDPILGTVALDASNTVSIAALPQPVERTFTTKVTPFTAQAPVALGTASTLAILSKTGITDVPASAVNGNVGASPITGAAIHLSCPEVQTGTIYTVDAAGPACKTTDATFLTTTVGNMEIAYNDAAGRTLPDTIDLGAGEIGGLTLTPGLPKWNTDLLIAMKTGASINGRLLAQTAVTLQSNAVTLPAS